MAAILVFAAIVVTLTVEPAKAFPFPSCDGCSKVTIGKDKLEATSSSGSKAEIPFPTCHACAGPKSDSASGAEAQISPVPCQLCVESSTSGASAEIINGQPTVSVSGHK